MSAIRRLCFLFLVYTVCASVDQLSPIDSLAKHSRISLSLFHLYHAILSTVKTCRALQQYSVCVSGTLGRADSAGY